LTKGEHSELTLPRKATNHRISSITIRIEHAIGRIKHDRVVKDRIPLLKGRGEDTIMEI
jgi:hypothetical protein